MTLGEFLRIEREKRGITLEQVASATKVSVRRLHALESDHYVELPSKPHIRGFVISYSRFIGLDSQEVLTQFGSFLDDKAAERPTREAGHSGYAFEKTGGDQNRTFLWVVMLSFIVIGGLLIIIIKPPLKHRRHRNAEKLQQVVAVMPSPQALAEPSEAAVAPSPLPQVVTLVVPSPTPVVAKPAVVEAKPVVVPSASPSPLVADPEDKLNTGKSLKYADVKHKIIIKSKAAVWVRYQSDDRVMMKFTLKKDGVLVLKAARSVRFQVSNPKSVTFSYNGSGTKPFLGVKGTFQASSGLGIYYPTEASKPDTTQDPFPGQSQLPKSPDPVLEDGAASDSAAKVP